MSSVVIFGAMYQPSAVAAASEDYTLYDGCFPSELAQGWVGGGSTIALMPRHKSAAKEPLPKGSPAPLATGCSDCGDGISVGSSGFSAMRTPQRRGWRSKAGTGRGISPIGAIHMENIETKGRKSRASWRIGGNSQFAMRPRVYLFQQRSNYPPDGAP
jgi:hypothetical protein